LLIGGGFGGAEISDGAGDLQDTVVRASAQSHAADGHFERALAGLIQGAELAQQARGNAGVVEAAPLLEGAGVLHSRAHLGRADSGILATQLFDRRQGRQLFRLPV
jgi:hypothetical protein